MWPPDYKPNMVQINAVQSTNISCNFSTSHKTTSDKKEMYDTSGK